MEISVVQYLRPDGRKRFLHVYLPDDLASQVKLIREKKLTITAEQLMSGVISQTLMHDEGDFAIELCNAGEAEKTLEKMIRSFDAKAFDEWLAGMQAESGTIPL